MLYIILTHIFIKCRGVGGYWLILAPCREFGYGFEAVGTRVFNSAHKKRLSIMLSASPEILLALKFQGR
jgi:hypothetical protein